MIRPLETRLRPGVAEDLAAITALHLASWRDSYRGLLPAAYLDGAVAEDLAAKWRQKLIEAPPPRSLLLLAEARDGDLLGFLYACSEPEHPGSAYIDNLHVRPDTRGGGLGTRLLRRAAVELQGLGYRGMHLRVFVDNAAAVRFYLRHGGRIVARAPDRLMGHPTETYRIAWTDLRPLAEPSR